MNTKQNLVFFIGLTLMIMVFWANGYWTILWNGIAPSQGVQPSGPGLPTKPKHGKCPPGYGRVGNMCWPNIKSGPPALM